MRTVSINPSEMYFKTLDQYTLADLPPAVFAGGLYNENLASKRLSFRGKVTGSRTNCHDVVSKPFMSKCFSFRREVTILLRCRSISDHNKTAPRTGKDESSVSFNMS